MNLARFLTAPGGVLLGINESVIVTNWLSMNEADAIGAIGAQVDSASTDDLDRLDEALLTMASIHFDPDVRTRLVKFYAMFKIVELLRFETFRGFPD
jgi:hypothetical protein